MFFPLSSSPFPFPFSLTHSLLGAAYNKDVIPKSTKAIRKSDDMAVQDLAAKQKKLSKFTKKLAKKDTISLV